MFQNLFILSVSMFCVIKGALLATKYATLLAKDFELSKYLVGLIVVSIISILPETFISINSSLSGIPEFGLGTLFGSNVADLTLVFVIIMALTQRNIKVEKKILKNNVIYPFIFFIPIIMGLNGHYSRIEGITLIITGLIFYYFEFKNNPTTTKHIKNGNGNQYKNALFLILSMGLLLIGSHFTVSSASDLALIMGVSPVLIGMLIVGIGTTFPEMLFSLQAIRQKDDSLAVGDILGTVLADATVVLGILIVINPFTFSKSIIYVSGIFMVLASFILSYFLRSERTLTQKESILLLLFWVTFALSEYFING